MRVLIVDDSEYILDILRMMFSEKNYEIQTALNGSLALSIFGQGLFDLVITDFNMPAMNGMALAHRMREIDSEVPIVVFTSEVNGPQIFEADLIKMGNAFCVEDKNIEELMFTVSKMLEVKS